MAREENVREALRRLTGKGGLAQLLAAKMASLSAAAPLESNEPPPEESKPWVWARGVAGLGVAEKEVLGKRLSDIVLKVYVEKKLPLGQVDQPVPKIVQLPGLPPIETDVVEVGKVELQGNTTMIRPAIPGYSIGLGTQPKEAGTFGFVVRKNGDPSTSYLLSNSHAIANSGWANVGDPIIQPGGADGGTVPANTIAALSAWVPFVYGTTGYPNLVDAAIAELTPNIASAAIAQLGIPTGINTNLARGQIVQKEGRTTTLSAAQILDVDLQIRSLYPNPNLPGGVGYVGFSDCVLVTFYSAGGDSGSPVLNMDREVVGLHFAGSDTIGCFCKIQNVMDLLDITPVTAQNP